MVFLTEQEYALKAKEVLERKKEKAKEVLERKKEKNKYYEDETEYVDELFMQGMSKWGNPPTFKNGRVFGWDSYPLEGFFEGRQPRNDGKALSISVDTIDCYETRKVFNEFCKNKKIQAIGAFDKFVIFSKLDDDEIKVLERCLIKSGVKNPNISEYKLEDYKIEREKIRNRLVATSKVKLPPLKQTAKDCFDWSWIESYKSKRLAVEEELKKEKDKTPTLTTSPRDVKKTEEKEPQHNEQTTPPKPNQVVVPQTNETRTESVVIPKIQMSSTYADTPKINKDDKNDQRNDVRFRIRDSFHVGHFNRNNSFIIKKPKVGAEDKTITPIASARRKINSRLIELGQKRERMRVLSSRYDCISRRSGSSSSRRQYHRYNSGGTFSSSSSSLRQGQAFYKRIWSSSPSSPRRQHRHCSGGRTLDQL